MDLQARIALGRLAQTQRGLFSAAQAAQLGISHAQLSRALKCGHLRRLRRGVYTVGGAPTSAWEDVLAAALAAGPGAAISHSSAAAVHRFYCSYGASTKGGPELTVLKSHALRLSGVRTHRGTLVLPGDVVVRSGVLVTSPARTLVDMAGRLLPVALERTLDEALIARQMRTGEVAACLARSPARLPGRARLQHLVDLRTESPTADSALEALAYLALAALAPFEAHYVLEVGGKSFVLDAAWPEHRVAVEIVGRGHRVASRSAFDRERRKLNVLAAAGWQIAHLTAVMSGTEMVAAVSALLPSWARPAAALFGA
jgi:very-short-patch-repair endonuclease